MVKLIHAFIAVFLLLILCAIPASAGPALGQVNLVQKDPGTWAVVPGGASATLTYQLASSEFRFTLKATGLVPREKYALIYYADKPNRFVNWGGDNPGAFIAYGWSDASGKMLKNGVIDLNMDLPSPPDTNYPVGAKVWLVPYGDYDQSTNRLIAWHPDKILFDDGLVVYNDLDVYPCVLENKDGSWNVIAGDGVQGGLIYDDWGDQLWFTFIANGVTPGVDYSLIYYADPWPGNGLTGATGALLASGTAATMEDGTGFLKLVRWEPIELNTSLPNADDQNFDTGAKIWLVLSSDYNPATRSMTAWQPAKYLFETSFITYDHEVGR